MATLLDDLLRLEPGVRDAALGALDEATARAILYDWEGTWARANQLPPPGDWRVWLILAGRGFGKTRTGAELVRRWVRTHRLVNVIGATADDARDIMIEGESGILAVCPDGERPEYRPARRSLEWPNGARTLVFTADEPERLRGKQHEKLWGDEIAAWRRPEAWDQAMLGLRLGRNPQAVVTTTPKPVRLVRELLASPTTHVTRGRTYDNATNLAPAFLEQIVTKYEGTRMGRQELNAELLDDVPGALWTRSRLDDLRVLAAPELERVVVAVDPAATSGEDADETGIVVAAKGADGHGYVLADRTCRLSPDGWARRAVDAYHQHKADRLVAETNNGGEMVELTVRTVDRAVAYTAVHASRGKRTRAEPVAALYEQGKVHHVGGFSDLEDQMCNYTPDGYDGSPDRVDALVYALTDLLLGARWNYDPS
jgi:predicted phage terminase large subunit-like protein